MARDEPCILFALERERRPFTRRFVSEKILFRRPDLRRVAALDGRGAYSLLTGVGDYRMRDALTWLLNGPRIDDEIYRPRLLISAGFSGALHDDLRVGDLVLGTEVVAESGERWPTTATQPGLQQVHCRNGALLTVGRFVTRPDEKRALAGRHGALAVDMESAVVAEMCQRQGVPFCCLRVISDDVHAPLSHHLDRIVVNGRVSPWALFKAVARSPRIIGDLWRLGKHTRLAADHLATALATLIHTMP